MKTEGELTSIAAGPLTALERAGEGGPTPAIILLHGYGGDERAMWVFQSALPSRARVIALRGPFPARDGGFRWHLGARWPPPKAAGFDQAVGAVAGALAAISAAGPVVLLGFSQGAALAFCCTAGGLPTRGIACLSGYLPSSLPPLPADLPVLWSHGVRDRHIPIRRARADAARLQAMGVEVELCQTDSGHRVGVDCLRALRSWLRVRSSV